MQLNMEKHNDIYDEFAAYRRRFSRIETKYLTLGTLLTQNMYRYM